MAVGDIRYIAELAQHIDFNPGLFISASIVADNDGQIISFFETGTPATDEYWTAWGGSYDNPETTQLQVYFSQFLTQVASIAALLLTENSFYISGTIVYTNTPYYPWQYPDTDTELLELEGVASAVSDPTKPSEIRYSVNGVMVPYPIRLTVPSSTMNNKLSDIISGVVLYSSFSIELNNEDGKYDKSEDTNYFNVTIKVKKSSVKNPTLEDFKTIRVGTGDNVSSDSQKMTVTIADINRGLDEEVCRVFTTDLFPDLPDDNVDKNIPVAWNSHYGAELYEVGTNEYLVVDPEYYVSIDAVYDSDGVSLDYTVDSDGIITITTEVLDDDGNSLDPVEYEEPDTCDFIALSKTIGTIITTEIEEKSNIAYTEGNWDLTETDYYIGASVAPSIYHDSGDVKTLIKSCLENDNAFLINKNDGRLTLRQWGVTYDTHTIPSWTLTKQPSRTHIAQKYYTSSVKIEYNYHIDTDEHESTYLDDSEESTITEKWRKEQRLTFETNLTSEADAIDLASRLLDRFKDRREVFTVYTGYDCSEINPLDTISLTITVNGREYSDVNTWIVRDVNPAQDTLVLEEESTTISYGAELSRVTDENYDGLMCMNASEDNDAILAQVFYMEEN